MLSLASASCFVTKQSCSIYYYEFPSSCPNSHLVVRLYQFIITFPCSHFVHTCTAKTRHLRCGIYTIIDTLVQLLVETELEWCLSMPVLSRSLTSACLTSQQPASQHQKRDRRAWRGAWWTSFSDQRSHECDGVGGASALVVWETGQRKPSPRWEELWRWFLPWWLSRKCAGSGASRPASQSPENLSRILIVRIFAHPKNQPPPIL